MLNITMTPSVEHPNVAGRMSISQLQPRKTNLHNQKGEDMFIHREIKFRSGSSSKMINIVKTSC